MKGKKLLSIRIPCYNEQENIRQICDAVEAQMAQSLPEYDYEIVLIDNKSTDRTRPIIRDMCAKNARIKAIFNIKNFGQFNSPYYGLLQCSGDCVISICADFQAPVEYIPVMVRQWEQGHKVICMVKTSSREKKIVYWLRSCYYGILKKMSDIQQIPHFTGFGLYDRSFIETLRQVDERLPFFRGIVAEYAPEHLDIPFEQPKRRAGKTHNNFYKLYDAAMLSFTNYTKAGLRIVTLAGFLIAALSLLVALIYFILKLCNWYGFDAGMAPMIIGIFLMGGLQLAAIGFVGEYILSINQRVMNKPIVVEEERINFDECSQRKPA